MHTSPPFPRGLRPPAHDDTGPMRLRLSGATRRLDEAVAHGANDSCFARPAMRRLRGGYLPARSSLPLFRVGS